jgi:hypothetical protein
VPVTPTDDLTLLRELMRLPTEDLMARFGGELERDTVGLSPLDARKHVERAVFWLEEHIADIRRELCGAALVQSFIARAAPYDALIEAATIQDGLAALRHYPAVATLSVILTRHGLKDLCLASDA